MEVLSRLLNKPPVWFRFYDRCERLGLTHLVFANNLMILCAAEKDSLEFVRQVLTDFAGLSGLVANVEKSSMFVASVESREAKKLAASMGFSLSSLPGFWVYLYWWLVRSVLQSFQVFWCSIFVLPACITHEVDRLLRSYLWKGSVVSRGGARVAWDEVCLPLGDGGFGVKHVASLNNSAIMKSEVGRSWCLRAILRSKDRFKHLVRLMIDDGRPCFVWWDPWLSGGAILDSYRSTVVYDIGSSLEAQLSKFMDGEGGWRWPTMSWELLEIWGFIQAVGPRERNQQLHGGRSRSVSALVHLMVSTFMGFWVLFSGFLPNGLRVCVYVLVMFWSYLVGFILVLLLCLCLCFVALMP
ncbi:uncharacterized protein LOC120081037 [Benincasa hispida]|uniref:uncharacterized protein LOC120081037 n=1 Tax=Benincasa hispida TaxID=102211 RepID=UPI0019020232|nr:uncharacterized protein LOC120081037 [Benincasa hispida]